MIRIYRPECVIRIGHREPRWLREILDDADADRVPIIWDFCDWQKSGLIAVSLDRTLPWPSAHDTAIVWRYFGKDDDGDDSWQYIIGPDVPSVFRNWYMNNCRPIRGGVLSRPLEGEFTPVMHIPEPLYYIQCQNWPRKYDLAA